MQIYTFALSWLQSHITLTLKIRDLGITRSTDQCLVPHLNTFVNRPTNHIIQFHSINILPLANSRNQRAVSTPHSPTFPPSHYTNRQNDIEGTHPCKGANHASLTLPPLNLPHPPKFLSQGMSMLHKSPYTLPESDHHP